MKRRMVLAAMTALTVAMAAPSLAQTRDAEALVSAEAARAGAEGRRLLLLFDASWCVYCRLTDAMLERPEASKIIDTHYRVLHVRAQERELEMKEKQLAGADDLYARLASKGVGMPYTVILAADGSVVATSVMKDGVNYGFPVTKQELDGFESMLKAGAPALTRAELKTMRKAAVATYNAKPGK